MTTYSYTAKNQQGQIVKGVLQAEGIVELLRKISERNLFCISYSEAKDDIINAKYRFKTKELAFCCRQFSSMLTSGMTLVKSLEIIHKENPRKAAKQIFLEMYEDVQKGQLLSESMIAQNGAFPPFLVSMISSSEASGSLDTVMTKMSTHYAQENKLNNKIRAAMTYPIILLVLSVAVVIGLFTFIMPQFVTMFSGTEIPKLTQIMIHFSDFLRTKWWVLIIGIFLLIFLMRIILRIPSVKKAFDRLKIKAPVFGKLIVKIYTGRFARTMSALYSNGIPMIECIEKSAAVLGNTYISAMFVQVIENVKQGEALSSSLAKTGMFEPMFCSIIYVGEESGKLDEILSSTSEYYEEEADSAIQKMVSMIEPIMIIFLGLIIGLVIASILPAMYSMFENVN